MTKTEPKPTSTVEMVDGGAAVLCNHGKQWEPCTHFWKLYKDHELIYARCSKRKIIYVLVASVWEKYDVGRDPARHSHRVLKKQIRRDYKDLLVTT